MVRVADNLKNVVFRTPEHFVLTCAHCILSDAEKYGEPGFNLLNNLLYPHLGESEVLTLIFASLQTCVKARTMALFIAINVFESSEAATSLAAFLVEHFDVAYAIKSFKEHDDSGLCLYWAAKLTLESGDAAGAYSLFKEAASLGHPISTRMVVAMQVQAPLDP